MHIRNKSSIYIVSSVLVLMLAIAYVLQNDIYNLLAYGWSDWPTHEPYSTDCPWKKEVFTKAGITAYVGVCVDKQALDPTNGYAMTFSDSDKEIGSVVT